MTITVATSKLIDVLTDTLQTACDTVGGVHIGTQRAPWRDEPSDVDLLTATSTTRTVIGHTWIPCDGRLTPAVWPVEATKTVKTICESLVKKGKDIHTVDIAMVMAPMPEDAKVGDHPGWTVTLSETPALWGSDTEFQFHAHAESVFPIGGVARWLTGGGVPPNDYEEVPVTLWSPAVLKPLVAVAARRKMLIQMFRAPDRALQVVQIGDTWLGAAYPVRPMPGDAVSEPSIEPVLGEVAATVQLRDALQDMADAGITVTVENPQGVVAQTLADAINAQDD